MSITGTGAFGTRNGSFRPATVLPVARRIPRWLASVLCGAAVLLAAAPVSAVVRGVDWLAQSGVVVGVVVAIGVLAALVPGVQRLPGLVVGAVQAVAVLLVLTLIATGSPVPGQGAFARFGFLFGGAVARISTGVAPVEPTPEILFLITTSLGVVAVVAHTIAVGYRAPAAAGVPLLAAFAVPAALADGLLPWWSLVAAAAGFGLLLLAPDGNRRQLPGGLTMVALATVLALALGAATSFIGTSGRFGGEAGPGEDGASIGLTPFTALRGQLQRSTPAELFEVSGLTRPTYMRALTLASYQGGIGWQAVRPAPGLPLDGAVLQPAAGVPGDLTDVAVTNLGFRDYWLPVFGDALQVGGLTPNLWTFDSESATAYSERALQEPSWTQSGFLPSPTPQQLRVAEGERPAPIYSNIVGVDPRVGELTRQITAQAYNEFDRVLAIQQFFTGPDTQFTYSLETAPPQGDDALVEFLTVGRTGYCEQFASAMAAMLRTIGIPSRVAVGFTAGTASGDTRTITTADAHAWVEAWFPGIGWTTFDPTPLADGRTVVPPYVAQALTEAAGGAPGTPAEIPVPQTAAPAPAEPAPTDQDPQDDPLDTPITGPTEDAAGISPLWALSILPVLLLAALVPTLLRARVRRSRLALVASGGPEAAAGAWEELLAESVDRGAPTPESDTVRAAARRLVREHTLDASAQDALRAVVTAVESSWYGDRHPAPGELTRPVADIRAGIAAGGGLTPRSRLIPRSVVGPTRRPSPAQRRRTAAEAAARAAEAEEATRLAAGRATGPTDGSSSGGPSSGGSPSGDAPVPAGSGTRAAGRRRAR